MKIDRAIHEILEENPSMSKYRLAQILEIKPIMITNYLNGITTGPRWKLCKKVYCNFDKVVSPYTQKELECEKEQLLLNYD